MNKEKFPKDDPYFELQKHFLEKYGYYIHFVTQASFTIGPEIETCRYSNYHTHKLQESYNHMDLQIVLPINTLVAQNIINVMVENIKKGYQYIEGEHLLKIPNMEDLTIGIIKKKDLADHNVLRIILPYSKYLYNCDIEYIDIYKNQENVDTSSDKLY